MDGQGATLLTILQAVRPRTRLEAADVAATLEVVASGDPWSRAAPLHVTCSALVVHPPSRRVLLRWHVRQQAWLQVGGHADPGEVDPFRVALREATEETGLYDLAPWPDAAPAVLHLVVVPVPAAGHEPAHHHADVRYLLATEHPEEARAESADAPLRWVTLDGADALTSEPNLRETLERAGQLLKAQGATDERTGGAMEVSLDGWDITGFDDVDWAPWGSGGKARAKVLASGDGFFLALVEAEPGYTGDPHSHAHTEMLYVLDGVLKNQGQEMKAGAGYVASAGSTHADFETAEGARYLSIFKL